MPECRKIARSNYIAEQKRLALEEYHALHGEEVTFKKRGQAAFTIQSAFRAHQMKQLIRRMIKKVYVKRVEPDSGMVFYFNTQHATVHWDKPAALRSGEDIEDPPDWRVRYDKEGDIFNCRGQYFYEQKSKGKKQMHKPEGYLGCYVCGLNFATRKCKTMP